MTGAVHSRDWLAANQRYLAASVAVLKDRLEHLAAGSGAGGVPADCAAETEFIAAAQAMPASPAIDTLAQLFALSSFEKDIVVLAAAVELDGSVAAHCARGNGDPLRPYPTFALAMDVLDDAHWSAFSPAAPLRYWRLVDIAPGGPLTTSAIRIDERILHFLAGVQYLDDRLVGLLKPVPGRELESMAETASLIREIARLWHDADRNAPIVNLHGGEPAALREIAASACGITQSMLFALNARDIPAAASERTALQQLWSRETALSGSALLVEVDDARGAPALPLFLEGLAGAIAIASREPVRNSRRPTVCLAVPRPAAAERERAWREALGPLADRLNGELPAALRQFDLDAAGINAAGASIRAREPEADHDLGRTLWQACREQARARLDDLAERIEPSATWADLVLPAGQRSVLKEIALHLRHRIQVYEQWGFGVKCARGLGIAALFVGASGTGKTMAAEVLAGELELDLYRIDLSQVVSKYIGETEKNLRRIFAAAEDGGAILLFDEADALFGKRSEVKDSHDRYANIEVSYLLQRMEAYRGLAILTTNLGRALDPAFQRRLRFIVQFPFPDQTQRAEIWRSIFPAETPVDGLDYAKLGRLNVAGGTIRNIALGAAFLAADKGGPVTMAHILKAAQSEYAKLERTLSSAEMRGWTQ